MTSKDGINPLHQEPNYVMFGPGAGTSQIVHRDTRKPVPPYEPILLLRASDPNSVRTVHQMAEQAAATDPARAQQLRQVAEKMAAFISHSKQQ